MSYLPLMVSYMIRVCVGSTVIKANLRTAQSYQTGDWSADFVFLFFPSDCRRDWSADCGWRPKWHWESGLPPQVSLSKGLCAGQQHFKLKPHLVPQVCQTAPGADLFIPVGKWRNWSRVQAGTVTIILFNLPQSFFFSKLNRLQWD